MTDYTPTTNEVRKRYSRGYLTEHVQQFDRWLAERDRKKQAQAWEEGYDEGYVDGSCDRERADNPYRQGENK